MKIQGVLFDMDGTIVDFKIDVIGIKRAIMRTFIDIGIPSNLLSETLPSCTMIQVAYRYLDQVGESPNRVFDIAYAAVEPFELESASDPSPKECIHELLSFLEKNKIRMALVTNSGVQTTKQVLAKLNLDGFFSAFATRDSMRRLKPYPDSILFALRLVNLCPSEDIYYVGDSWIDATAAISAGITPIGVSEDRSSRDEMLAAGCRTCFSDLRELKSFFESVLNEGG